MQPDRRRAASRDYAQRPPDWRCSPLDDSTTLETVTGYDEPVMIDPRSATMATQSADTKMVTQKPELEMTTPIPENITTSDSVERPTSPPIWTPQRPAVG
jgi:hypothetical protein